MKEIEGRGGEGSEIRSERSESFPNPEAHAVATMKPATYTSPTSHIASIYCTPHDNNIEQLHMQVKCQAFCKHILFDPHNYATEALSLIPPH